jgi:hypothetical protein
MKKLIASLLVAGALSTGAAGIANAQTTTTTPVAKAAKTANGGFSAHAPAIAKALGITVDELNTALTSGKTVATLAKEKGVDLNKILATWIAEEQAEHPDMAAADVTKKITDQANGVAAVGGKDGGRVGKGGGGRGGRHGHGKDATTATTVAK